MSFLTEALERQLRKLKPELAPPVRKTAPTKIIKPSGERAVHLVFQEGSSDKEYLVRIVPAAVHRGAGLFDVRFEYGRRGGTHQKGTKNSSPMDSYSANVLFDEIVSEKKKKGYREI